MSCPYLCRWCEQVAVRQQKVVEMTREGLSAAQIGRYLKVAPRTVQRDRVALGIDQPAPKHERESARRALEERRERVAQLTRAGLSASQIAQELKTALRTVQRDREKLGIAQPGPVLFTPEEHQRAIQMLEDGYPFTEVARTLGRHRTTVQKRYRGMSQVNGGEIGRMNYLRKELGLL